MIGSSLKILQVNLNRSSEATESALQIAVEQKVDLIIVQVRRVAIDLGVGVVTMGEMKKSAQARKGESRKYIPCQTIRCHLFFYYLSGLRSHATDVD